MLHKMILRAFFIFAMLSGIASAEAQQMEADVVYESPELLTKSMLRKHAQFVQELLGIEYTPEQTAKHYRMIKEQWVRQDFTGIRSVQAHVALYDQLKQMSPLEYRSALNSLRQALMQSLPEDAAVRDDARWYLQNYVAKHVVEAVIKR